MGEAVELYTDGACVPNPGPGGWGVVLRSGKHERELHGGEPGTTTNNRMELMAAIQGLEALKRACAVSIYTDSTYVKSGVTSWMAGWKANGWLTSAKEPVKNVDLWQRLERALAPHEVQWHWVKGHAGHPENERADRLAAKGVVAVAPEVAALLEPKPAKAKPAKPRGPRREGPGRACGATTKTGKPCPITAGGSGLCHVHDPALQCGAALPSGKACAVATGGGRCGRHVGRSGGLFSA